MTARMAKIVVTGAAGFLGRALTARLIATTSDPDCRFVFVDRVPIAAADPRVRCVTGDLADPAMIDDLVAGAQVLYHLAAIPGGAAETDYGASRTINLDASLRLLERAAVEFRPVRFVYASSIAVFGEPLPPHIDDATCPRPSLTYGAHKLMVSVALCNLTRLRRLDGLALHLPGLVARPRSAAGMKSAFMSDVFHAMANGEEFVLPTGAEATAWFMSRSCCVDNLLHAGTMPAAPQGAQCALTLPVVRASMRELIGALAQHTHADPALVEFRPEAKLEAQFGRLPPLTAARAESLGFRSDGSLQALVANALHDAGYLF
jgi:nucleoside-diphosphate-sugar epimerase